MAVSSAWSVPSSVVRQLSATSVDATRYGCAASYGSPSNSSRIVSPMRKLHIGRHSTPRTDGIHLRKQGSSIRASQEASTFLVQEVVFVWRGPGSEVLLTGDFLKWETKLALEKISNGVFILTQNLGLGKYAYKFIVDGEWKHSPHSPTVPDTIGGLNNEVIVTDQNTRESAKSSSDSPKTEASRPTEIDNSENSGNGDDGAKPEPKKSNSSSESANATKTAQKSDGENGAEASSKPFEAVEAATSTKRSDGGDKAETSPKPSQKAGAAASVKTTVDGDKAEASPNASQKAEAANSTKKSDTDKPDDKSSTTTRPRPAAKKKAPEKPFEATMLEDVVPQLTSTLTTEDGLVDVDVTFEENQLKVGFVKEGIPYCFWAFFPDGSFTGARGSSLTSHGSPPSTIEPFLVDEKKINAEMVVFWVKKRLFAQNLLSMN